VCHITFPTFSTSLIGSKFCRHLCFRTISSDQDHLLFYIKSTLPSGSEQTSMSSSEALFYRCCRDFDSLVLHGMHKRKCTVSALNYIDTFENHRVHQSNNHSEATLELQVVKCNIWWECSGFLVASSRTHPYSVGSTNGGSGFGADFHTAI